MNNEDSGARLKSKLVERNVNKIDAVFTQFGYANWTGNPEQRQKRAKTATEKASRIKIIDKYINPDTIVLYASYIYFCHKDNSYMNDRQNTPRKIESMLSKSSTSNKLAC